MTKRRERNRFMYRAKFKCGRERRRHIRTQGESCVGSTKVKQNKVNNEYGCKTENIGVPRCKKHTHDSYDGINTHVKIALKL